MVLKATIKKMFSKMKDVGMGIMRKGTIKDSPKNREAIKKMMERMPQGMETMEMMEKRKRKIIEGLEMH